MEYKDQLTNENIKKKFKSQFELVNYAIRLAENMIRTGRDPRVKTDVQNRALQILVEINSGKDQFDEIPVQTAIESALPANEERKFSSKQHSDELPIKNAERKKARKII